MVILNQLKKPGKSHPNKTTATHMIQLSHGCIMMSGKSVIRRVGSIYRAGDYEEPVLAHLTTLLNQRIA